MEFASKATFGCITRRYAADQRRCKSCAAQTQRYSLRGNGSSRASVRADAPAWLLIMCRCCSPACFLNDSTLPLLHVVNYVPLGLLCPFARTTIQRTPKRGSLENSKSLLLTHCMAMKNAQYFFGLPNRSAYSSHTSLVTPRISTGIVKRRVLPREVEIYEEQTSPNEYH